MGGISARVQMKNRPRLSNSNRRFALAADWFVAQARLFSDFTPMKIKALSIVIVRSLVCIELLPKVQAVNPPPDAGYSGNNTAEGTSAVFSLTSGIANTALGSQALSHNTTGNYNTAQGFRALFSNTSGDQNTATGSSALRSNTTGFGNTANA